jgi:hypothetical protein
MTTATKVRPTMPRTIRLGDLAPEQRAYLVELVEVARRNAARAVASPPDRAE